jgi:hypothetical protein
MKTIIELELINNILEIPNYRLGIFLLKLVIKIMGKGKINRIYSK